MRWLSGKVLKNSMASTSWLCRPRVGGAPPGQYTATFSVWRFLKVSQRGLAGSAFQASSSVVIRSISSSSCFIGDLPPPHHRGLSRNLALPCHGLPRHSPTARDRSVDPGIVVGRVL